MLNPTLNAYKTSIGLVPFEGSLAIYATLPNVPYKIEAYFEPKNHKKQKDVLGMFQKTWRHRSKT